MKRAIENTKRYLRNPRAAASGFAFIMVLSVLVLSFSPLFTGKALALSTSVDMMKRHEDTRSNTIESGTCEPYFESVPKSPDLLKTFFMDRYEEWIGKDVGGSIISTKIGYKRDADSNNYASKNPEKYIGATQFLYVINGVNATNIPVIKFRKTGVPMPGSATANPVDGVCESLVMLPVSNSQWRGFQRTLYAPPSPRPAPTFDGIYRYMWFQLNDNNAGDGITTGDFHFYKPDVSSADLRNWNQTTLNGFHIDQDIPWTGAPGTGTPINVSEAKWVDVTTLTMTGEQGGTYKRLSWSARGGKTVYFLSEAGATPDASRAELINAPRCDNPYTSTGAPVATCDEAGGKANCVPFIAVDQPINFSRNEARDSGNLSHLQSWIDNLGYATGKYYTYNNARDCVLLNPGGTNVTFTSKGSANLWFAYSKVNDSFLSLFKTGDGNEVIYLGQYTKTADRAYSGGQGGCAGVIRVNSSTNLADPGNFTVDWQLGKEGLACTAPNRFYGTLQVRSYGGAEGEAAFNDTAPGVEPDTTVTPLEDVRIGCDYFENGLSWIICPFVRGAMNLVGLFDSLINKLLNIETGGIFDGTTQTGAAYHKAWGVFRTFALVLIVIAALIMVIAQAAGIEILDAYTIKKILPRLLMVTIGITLSWELMRFAVTLSNDLGQGIRGIIYAPFSSLEPMKQLNLGANFALLLLGSGAILTYGIIGLLSLVVTAVLASLVAVALLSFREVAIIFLIIIAPLAIAAAILPFTQKMWKFWYNTFLGLLMVFIFISAFIAIGRVFSVTAATSGDVVSQLIAVLAYFAPYFMIPFAFKLAGGAIATVAGLVNDRSRGMFDRLKNFRARTSKERMKRLGEGSLFNPESKATRFLGGNAVNRVGAHVGAMRGPGGWRAGFGQKGRAKMANNAFAKYDQYSSEDADFKAQVDNEDAMAAHAAGNSYAALAAMEWFQEKDANGRATGKANDAKIRSAIAASSTIQMTGRSRAAALDAVAASGKIFAAGRTGRSEHKALVQQMAGGNEMLRNALMGGSQWRMRTAGGRQDIGRGSTAPDSAVSAVDDAWESLKEANLGTLSQQKPWGVEGMVQDAVTLLQPGARIKTGGKNSDGTAATRELSREERQHIMDIAYGAQFNPYTNAYQQEEVAKLLRDPGVQDLVDQARTNYSAKLGGGYASGGGVGAPPAGAVIPPGPARPTAPPPPTPPTPPGGAGGPTGPTPPRTPGPI